MEPAHAPLPTAWYFLFQPEVGSQTSSLISESLEGFMVAVIRQNSGRALYAELSPRPPAGGAKRPAPTVWAEVIVVSGSVWDARLSQVAAQAGTALKSAASRNVGYFISRQEPRCRPSRGTT